MNNNNKNLKAMILPFAALISLVIGMATGISAEAVTQIEDAIISILTGVLAILAAVGIWKNNDKDPQ